MKLATVFQDANGKWMGSLLPFPAKEMYGTDEDGEAICETRDQAEKACIDAGVERIVSDEEFDRDFI